MSRSSDRKYVEWRDFVVNRDMKCMVCGEPKKLRAHHIYSWKHYPELRYKLSNGITLCSSCHIRFHTDYKNSYIEPCTEKDMINFIRLANYFMKKQ